LDYKEGSPKSNTSKNEMTCIRAVVAPRRHVFTLEIQYFKLQSPDNAFNKEEIKYNHFQVRPAIFLP
jgi:hypothetical protein